MLTLNTWVYIRNKKKQSTIVLLGAINMYVRFNQYLIIFLYLKFQNNHRGILFT
jgi:hypothetical protein